MQYNRIQPVRAWLCTALIVGAGLTIGSCSSKKAESSETTTADTAATGDSSVFGRQGDTTNNALNAPQQAPADSADRGAVVPAEVKVTPKK